MKYKNILLPNQMFLAASMVEAADVVKNIN